MKKLMCVLAAVLMFAAVNVMAQTVTSQEVIDLAKSSYLKGLNSEYATIRNSIIFQIVRLKQLHPDENLTALQKELQKVCKKDSDYLNRYHAHLACEFIEDKPVSTEIDPFKFEDSKKFFDQFYNYLSYSQIASK